MHFCSQCDNMYYLRLAGEGGAEGGSGEGLTFYCRHCGHEDPVGASQEACALETVVHSQREQYSHAVNAHTRQDPTLPRTTSIRCPSSGCPSNQPGGKRDVVYLRYDDTGMRYLYICDACGVMWKTSDNE